jgi:hypothetical protein
MEALTINLSLSRPRESEEDVYVGLKLNRMVVDMMHRVDEARLKLQPFAIMHMVTTPQQVRHSDLPLISTAHSLRVVAGVCLHLCNSSVEWSDLH